MGIVVVLFWIWVGLDSYIKSIKLELDSYKYIDGIEDSLKRLGYKAYYRNGQLIHLKTGKRVIKRINDTNLEFICCQTGRIIEVAPYPSNTNCIYISEL